MKKIKKQTQRTGSFSGIAVRETMFCQFFSSPLQRVVPYILVHDPSSISGPHNQYPTLIPCYPPKRNVDALLKVGVIIKVEVFRTLCCVVARIALATVVAGQYIVCASNKVMTVW